MLRLHALDNGEALRDRPTVGTAALTAAQRVAASLRCRGIRAKVASTTDMIELEKRLDASVLGPRNRGWRSLRGDSGWHTSYGYRPGDITSEALGQAWSLRADAIIQNITVFSDGTAATTVTVRTSRPPTTPPAVILQPLPGQQAGAAAANLCGPRPEVRGLLRGGLPPALVIPIGPSGVLIGKISRASGFAAAGRPGRADPGAHCRRAGDSQADRHPNGSGGAAGDRPHHRRRGLAKRADARHRGHRAPTPRTGYHGQRGGRHGRPAPRPNTVLSVAPRAVRRLLRPTS